ncbi:cytochrome-c oxidase, cbb3-type subunit II [Candidatus Marithrix sp. Canyon 246]|uniref:cytochrome-c oxidase, cbb3-type subunit II n=1 Tax=Candidatus Marithrix sp. Canyon 246 TaxID=1827136 RepID=UPI00084A2C5C|nr:cytochrome-c oxidase, cbb3-type subunit II [Candidatus Marithrix sp. Canyon 246]
MADAHKKVETNIGLMIILTTLVVSVGGLVQIVPLFFMKSMTEPVEGLKPYPALQLAGRDIYVRESCMVCHSQMIRPFRAETERYGHYSVAGEFVYDRPFQWGSKRTGPDLHRVGGRYSDEWHYAHLINPRDVVPESVMPGYPSLAKNFIDGKEVQYKMQTLKDWFDHPYTDQEIANAAKAVEGKTEIEAIIAYLQGLGKTIKNVR